MNIMAHDCGCGHLRYYHGFPEDGGLECWLPDCDCKQFEKVTPPEPVCGNLL